MKIMCKKINDAGITSEYRFLRRSKIINYGLLLIAVAILMTILTIALQIQVIDLLKIEQTETGSFQAIMNEAAVNLILKLPITSIAFFVTISMAGILIFNFDITELKEDQIAFINSLKYGQVIIPSEQCKSFYWHNKDLVRIYDATESWRGVIELLHENEVYQFSVTVKYRLNLQRIISQEVEIFMPRQNYKSAIINYLKQNAEVTSEKKIYFAEKTFQQNPFGLDDLTVEYHHTAKIISPR